jgi:2'-5' RNA ligase
VERVRAFIAIPVSEEIRREAREVVGRLRRAGASVKWVEPENMHITLKFLGDISPDDVENLRKNLAEVLEGHRPFEMTAAGVGCFPSGRRAPRVVWIGLEGETERLGELAAGVECACGQSGFEAETRPFRAHLTIGRVRRESGNLRELTEAVGAAAFNPLKLRVDRVNLVRSRLSPKGPTYTVLESISLEDS